jgi:hypothetical protein
VLACGDAGSTTTGPPPGPTEITFAAAVQPILTRSCAFDGCHAGSNPQLGMDLSEGAAYGNLVRVSSVQVPRLQRVAPSAPDSSYVILKLEGDAGTVGGVGTRMPLGGALTQAQIDTIRAWVGRGAPDN